MSLLGLLFEGFWLRGAKEGTGGSCSDKVVPFLIYNSTRNKKQGQKKEKNENGEKHGGVGEGSCRLVSRERAEPRFWLLPKPRWNVDKTPQTSPASPTELE